MTERPSRADWLPSPSDDFKHGNGLDASRLGEWDAGDDNGPILPRGWLLGNLFCRGFISSLLADGGTGKTALRYAQYLALATGRQLTGDHVFQRCRVLIVSLEDGREELRRRIRAVRIHFGIGAADLKGWLFLAAPGGAAGKLMVTDGKGQPARAALADEIERVVKQRNIDLVGIDPFKKSHSLEENANSAIDDVMQLLADLATAQDIAVDAPHHTAKGAADPGNANRGRGASAMKDAARLVYTLTAMSPEEAQAFNIPEAERRRLVRMDSAKVNIAPPLAEARWFRLIPVALGNGTEFYPHGDEVQTVEPWTPPDAWAGLTPALANRILDDIEAGLGDGNRYSDARSADTRGAWRVVLKHLPTKSEGEARSVVKKWVKTGLLERDTYENPKTRKQVSGLHVVAARRPGVSTAGTAT